MFHSNHVFKAPLKGLPWNWVPALGVKNLNDGATGPRKKFDIRHLQPDQPSGYNTRTRQIDGHRPNSKDRAYALSRGKNLF